jgi:hypothetical protein
LWQSMSFRGPTSSRTEPPRHGHRTRQGREVDPKTLLKLPTRLHPVFKIRFSLKWSRWATFSITIRSAGLRIRPGSSFFLTSSMRSGGGRYGRPSSQFIHPSSVNHVSRPSCNARGKSPLDRFSLRGWSSSLAAATSARPPPPSSAGLFLPATPTLKAIHARRAQQGNQAS